MWERRDGEKRGEGKSSNDCWDEGKEEAEEKKKSKENRGEGSYLGDDQNKSSAGKFLHMIEPPPRPP